MKLWMAAAVLLLAASCSGPQGHGSNLKASATGPTGTDTPTPTFTPGEPFRFAVIGDFGTGSPQEYAIARRMCIRHRDRPLSMVITAGDNIYPDGSRDRFRAAFFDPFRCLLNRDVQWHVSLGNHDVVTDNGGPELEEPAFGIPRRNYVVSARGVRFVLANSNSFRWEWLRRALTARKGDRWTVVAFHHPVFSPGTHHGSTPGLRPRLPRLFRKKGVDLVFNGHDHIYAASKRIGGIYYVVTGGGGAPLYRCHDAWFAQKCEARSHFVVVRAGPRSATVKAIGPGGRVFHSFKTDGLD